MTCDTRETSALDTAALLDALRRGDEPAAERSLAAADAPNEQLGSLADGLMRRRRWRDAAWLFGRIESRDAATELKRTLSRNVAAMQVHRPEIYGRLVALPASDAFGVSPAANGMPIIVARRPDGSVASLSAEPDPLAAAHATLAPLRRATPNGDSIALCGLGHGYLLQLLAQNPPGLFMDMQQAVFVIEPEPQVLLRVLMIHDCAGADGPIRAGRFRWFVGPEWRESLAAAVEAEPTIGIPTVTVRQGPEGEAVQADVQAAVRATLERDAAAKRDVEAYYATLTPAMLAQLLGSSPPRPPRVLLLTTRFSTVLQYSTRDAADAFRALGWDAHVLIEPGPSHRLYQHSMRAALAGFKPDLVFQIDHLRHEHKDLFPANVPFVCWGQDHLPNLITADAGRRVGELDFVLTDNAVGYARNYAYPARQLIATPKLTVVAEPAPPRAVAAPRAEDIVFVSNASRTPERLLDEELAAWDGSDAALAVLRDGAERIEATYVLGGTVSTYGEVRAVVAAAQAARHCVLLPAETLRVSKWLTHPFNDALYRQQALRWAAAAAANLGLSLGLYGNGWDAHPDFAALARGAVAYGEPLRDLTRRAAINLQIVPYLCLHQRLLDGLSAGGFFLVRQNPNDVYPQALLNFVEQHVGGDVRTTRGARGGIDPGLLPELDALLRAAAPGTVSTDDEDVVALVRDWADAGLLQTGGAVLPRLNEVSFDGEARLAELISKFVNAPSARREIGAEQRRAVLGRLSYTAGIARVQRRIAALLRETAAAQHQQGVRKCA